MGLLVGSQITRLGEAFLAAWIAAHIWLLTCMGAKVCAQVEVKAEAFVANFTFVWFFASVDELMSL